LDPGANILKDNANRIKGMMRKSNVAAKLRIGKNEVTPSSFMTEI